MLKWKKLLNIVSLTLVFALTSCGEDSGTFESNESGTEELSLEDIQNAMNKKNEKTAEKKDEVDPILGSPDDIDVDLTVLSSTMVLSQVYDMLSYPESYVGDIVKMDGQFTSYEDDTGRTIYACLIEDAAACCQSGFEFTWEAFEDPANIPEALTEIEVVGVFDTYSDGVFEYATLDATSVVFK